MRCWPPRADPNAKAHVSPLTTRKNADHATGGFTALMFAVRNGHENVVRALVKGGADLKATNGDGVTATSIAIDNDRFDLAKTLLDLGADPNDGALYFAVDMHDATTDMRAHDGSRLRADHPNQLTALDLVKLLLERGADPNKPFVGQIHNTYAVLRSRAKLFAVLPRRDRGRRRSAQADDQTRRASRLEPRGGQEGKEGG